MKDLSSLRDILIDLKFLKTTRCPGNYALNYRRKSDFESWKLSNELWGDDLSYFSSEDELMFYLCKPHLTQETYCQNCGKQLSFEQIKTGRKSCSKECKEKISHSEEWSRKYKENWKNKTPEELAKIKSHLEDTMMKKYGVRHNWCKGTLRDKEEQTWLEKYGVDNPLKSKTVREKIVKSLTDNYEEGNYANRKKASESWRNKLQEEINERNEKIKESWRNKTQEEIDERTERTRKTNLEKYGSETPWYLPEARQKSKETCLRKYGVEHYSQSEEIKNKKKETCKKHYGVESPFQSEEILDKCKKNNLERYGYEWVSQSPEFQSKIHKRYEYDGLKFDSSDELYYYIYNKEILQNDIKRGKIFNYQFEGENRYYHCDFYVNGEDVEIKGSQYIKEGKLYFPYRNQKEIDWVQKQKEWDAKWKCMVNNNVKVILTDSDEFIQIRKAVDDKFTSDFVKLFQTNLNFPYLNPDLHNTTDMGLIHHFHKSIYSASRKGKLSPVKAWCDKSIVKKMALNRLKYVSSCKPSDIVQAFNVTLEAPKVSVFKPKTAEYLIKKYICDCDSIVDPFSGFSGRLIGSENCGKLYTGWDINLDHVDESKLIIQYKGYHSEVEVQDLITADVRDYGNKNTALFTCPPYGGKEHWNENNDEIEKSCDEWIDLCLEKYQNCQKYLFVVDKTDKYKNNIVEELEQDTHFGKRREYVILICYNEE